MLEKDKVEYFKRSYRAVDGLWFMKVEEKYGFEAALEIDDAVWEVFPKIQARKLKEILHMAQGLEALRQCLAAKHTLEEFGFEIRELTNHQGLQLVISFCPWYEMMLKSGRQQLAGRVGTRICNSEYGVWANEFGPAIRFELETQICMGENCCRLNFIESSDVNSL